jgi:hypothetical protein
MSEFDNTVDNDGSEVEATSKKRGQSKRTREELMAIFDESGVDGFLEIKMSDKGNSKCTVRRIEGKEISTIFGPCAGNSLVQALRGLKALGPYVVSA